MTQFLHHRTTSLMLAVALSTLVLLTNSAPATAAPGAHGPNGEHLDGPTTIRTASVLPHVEAQSESFELVAELRASELAVVIDRYESNEPVLGATLEVASGALKAIATFRAEQGDYVVTDTAMLKALAAPGEHGLIFTLIADKDGDLLDGTLVQAVDRVVTTAAKSDHGHVHGSDDHGHANDHELEQAVWIGSVVALGLIGMAWWRLRRDAGQLRKGL